ncbi:unnamed protein product [Notodromas monacha]|uniref:Uncharacterized protein n=1 Tax=Notodromas monacha TaxID=399045 RepID=A0A7R9BY75_9CRUS|nr:unnamed protein product [Notodromas monacha]CAG0923556.1 unnamed protein product [Notodromas monacha]
MCYVDDTRCQDQGVLFVTAVGGGLINIKCNNFKRFSQDIWEDGLFVLDPGFGSRTGVGAKASDWLNKVESKMAPVFKFFRGGTGTGLTTQTAYLLINKHFSARRGLAIGLLYSTAPLARTILPTVEKALEEKYGNRGALLFMSGIMLNIIPAAVWIRKFQDTSIPAQLYKTAIDPGTAGDNGLHLPVSIHESLINIVEGKTKVLILEIPYIHWLRKKLNKSALTASRGSLPAFKELMLRPLNTFRLSLVRVKMLHSQIKFILDYPEYLMNALDSGETPSCIKKREKQGESERDSVKKRLEALYRERWNPEIGSLGCVNTSNTQPFLVAGSRKSIHCSVFMDLVMPFVRKSFWGLGISTFLYGVGSGTSVCFGGLVLLHYFGLDNLPISTGIGWTIKGLVLLVLGPLIGGLKDLTGDFSATYFLLSGGMALGTVIWALEPVIEAWRTKMRPSFSVSVVDVELSVGN